MQKGDNYHSECKTFFSFLFKGCQQFACVFLLQTEDSGGCKNAVTFRYILHLTGMDPNVLLIPHTKWADKEIIKVAVCLLETFLSHAETPLGVNRSVPFFSNVESTNSFDGCFLSTHSKLRELCRVCIHSFIHAISHSAHLLQVQHFVLHFLQRPQQFGLAQSWLFQLRLQAAHKLLRVLRTEHSSD